MHEHRTSILKDSARNKVVDKLFRQGKKDVAVISDLIDLFE